jgi:hemoglobin
MDRSLSTRRAAWKSVLLPGHRPSKLERTMRTRLLVPSILLVLGVAAVCACGGKPPPKEPPIAETIADAGAEDAAPPEPPKPKSLYERLGGKEAIAKVIDTFVKNVAADTKINKRFAKTKGDKLDKFKANMVDQICEATGGDCKYSGKSMKDAHKGMKIKEEEWNALLLDLKNALEENKVGDAEQNDLVALLAPMKDDIVEVKPKAK